MAKRKSRDEIRPAASARQAAAARAQKHPGQAPNETEAAIRRANVFEMRRAGGTFRSIAKALHIDVATAHRDWKMALDELLPVDEVDELRRAEMDRMDGLRQALWPKALADSKRGDYRAVDRYMLVSERYARLAGIDWDMRIEEQRLGIEQQRMEMLRDVVMAGLAALGLTADQERIALAAMVERQRAIEANAIDVTSRASRAG